MKKNKFFIIVTMFCMLYTSPSHADVATASSTDINVETYMGRVATNGGNTFIIDLNGALWGWGQNNYGELGRGYAKNESIETPQRIGDGWRYISAGQEFVVGIKLDGTLWAWGKNGYGQLGLGYASEYVATPTRVGTANSWRLVQAGADYVLAIKADGSLWAWGSNERGQLGLGYVSDYVATPTRVGKDNGWKYVSTKE